MYTGQAVASTVLKMQSIMHSNPHLTANFPITTFRMTRQKRPSSVVSHGAACPLGALRCRVEGAGKELFLAVSAGEL